MKKFKIGKFTIGTSKDPFIIAEAGVNHNGSITIGKKMIDVAAKVGANAIKFQSFITDEIILEKAPKSTYHKRTTGSDKQLSWYEMLKTQEMDSKMHLELLRHCKKKKIIFLSTPYDEKSADYLEKIGIKAFKIASTDNNNIKLLSHIAKKKIPMILSAGMINMKTLGQSVKEIKRNSNYNIAILQCTSNYPCNENDVNLQIIKTFERKFKLPIGFSDHTEGYLASVVATTMGACIIEKHFTLDKNLPGPDHTMSLNPEELKNFIKKIKSVSKVKGVAHKKVLATEIENLKKLKKSLVSKTNILKNEKIQKSMINLKRPGTGIPANEINSILGKKAKKNIYKNTILKSNMFK